jgi:hypothetical protein
MEEALGTPADKPGAFGFKITGSALIVCHSSSYCLACITTFPSADIGNGICPPPIAAVPPPVAAPSAPAVAPPVGPLLGATVPPPIVVPPPARDRRGGSAAINHLHATRPRVLYRSSRPYLRHHRASDGGRAPISRPAPRPGAREAPAHRRGCRAAQPNST